MLRKSCSPFKTNSLQKTALAVEFVDHDNLFKFLQNVNPLANSRTR